MPGKTILLVEDNPDDVALTLRAFKKNNIANDVTVARDGVEALDALLPSGGGPPKLFVLDPTNGKISDLNPTTGEGGPGSQQPPVDDSTKTPPKTVVEPPVILLRLALLRLA